MATTTTNYGFDVPTSSDLVKNGATAISTLGQDIDTFLFRPFNKNIIINGGFDIWQRGTSYGGTGYGADRWYASLSGTVAVSQETSDLPSAIGVQYGIKYVTSASSSYAQFYQALESAVVKPLRGQTVTASFYLKTAGSYAGSVNLQIDYSTSTDALTSQTVSVTTQSTLGSTATSWIRVTKSFTVPTDAVGLRFGVIPDTAQASGVTVRVTGVQLELGSQATPFSRMAGTIQGELAACQRYYLRTSTGTGGSVLGNGYTATTSVAYTSVQFPVTMRITPTAVDFVDLRIEDQTGSAIGISAVTLSNPSAFMARTAVTISGATAGRFCQLQTGSTNGYIGFSAELQEMTMDNVTFVIDLQDVEHAIIAHADGSFTSMTKETYDAQLAAQGSNFTPIATDEAKAQ